MKLPRPYVPLSVRLIVAEKMYSKAFNHTYPDSGYWPVKSERLRRILHVLFPFQKVQLDHDPALENRKQIWRRGTFIRYCPDANDPDFLIYREKHAHYIKTNVRGDGAQYPDRVLAKRERRRLKKEKPKWKPRRVKHIKRERNNEAENSLPKRAPTDR